MQGRAIAVVGPSGAGKDTLIDAAMQARPDLLKARRVITRPTTAGGEDFDGATVAEFQRRAAAGDFILTWQAHGLHYAIPHGIMQDLNAGRDVILNLSRAVLVQARDQLPNLRVIMVTAAPEILAARLSARGRESTKDIATRLARADYVLPDGLDVAYVDNSVDLRVGLQRFLSALTPPD
jgi:ribose 1,5-bisphosphokinase